MWTQASTDMPAFAKQYKPQLAAFAKTLVGFAGSLFVTVLAIVAAVIFAAITLAYSESARAFIANILARITGSRENGEHYMDVIGATIKSVANGVIGVAFVQALLVGIGFFVVGVPGAGLLSILAMALGVVQIPVVLVTLPAIIWAFAAQSYDGRDHLHDLVDHRRPERRGPEADDDWPRAGGADAGHPAGRHRRRDGLWPGRPVHRRGLAGGRLRPVRRMAERCAEEPKLPLSGSASVCAREAESADQARDHDREVELAADHFERGDAAGQFGARQEVAVAQRRQRDEAVIDRQLAWSNSVRARKNCPAAHIRSPNRMTPKKRPASK